MMGKGLLLQPVITATLRSPSSRGTEKLAAQCTTLRQLSIYTNEQKGRSIFKKSEKRCMSANFQKPENGQQRDSPASKPAAPLKGRKLEAEIRLATGLNRWNNVKHDTEFSSQPVDKLHDGKDLAGEMLS